MNRFSLEQMERAISRKPEPAPDFEAMWSTIEEEVGRRRSGQSSTVKRSSVTRKWVPAAASAVVFLGVAVPVFAAINPGWDLWERPGVNNAIQHGFGEPLDLSARQSGTTMKLHGVVTDGEQMDVLFTMQVPGLPDYDAVDFESVSLSDSKGKDAEPNVLLKRDEEKDTLKGMFELQDELKKSKRSMHLDASNLIFYQYDDLPLAGDIAEGSMLAPSSSAGGFAAVEIQSIVRKNDQLTIRYALTSPLEDPGNLDPHLVITSGSQTYQSVSRAVLPPDGNNMLFQSTFAIPEADWKGAKLHLTYLQEIKRVAGTWAFDFNADGSKASEAIYSKPLPANEEQAANVNLNLKQLVITPLQIRVPYRQASNDWTEGVRRFTKVSLQLGDQRLEGSDYHTGMYEKVRHREYLDEGYLRFESPTWFKDWSGEPMKLIFSGLEITKRDLSKHWYDLATPTATEQQVQMDLDGRKVTFTYYLKGSQLIVKSSSEDPTFKGVSQSVIRAGGKEILPDYVPAPPSSGPFTKVETYSNLPVGTALQLNPGVYVLLEPDETVEAAIN